MYFELTAATALPPSGKAKSEYLLLKSVEILEMSNQLSSQGNSLILCYYANVSQQIQVVRIGNIPNWYFERVMFPGQRMMFQSWPEAILEIHTGAVASAILSDKIPCYVLRVIEEINADEVQDEAEDEVQVRAVEQYPVCA